MFFRRKPLYVPKPPESNHLEAALEMKKSEQEFVNAQRQAHEANIVVSSARETRRQNHFAPNLEASFRRGQMWK